MEGSTRVAAETGFQIDGVIYEVPAIDTLTMDEAQVLYDYSGLRIEDFVERENETADDREQRERKFENPGFMRALMHIAYQRVHTDLRNDKVRALIGSANILQALGTLSSGEESEELPPASTTEPEPSSPNGSVDSNETSGSDSTTDSAKQDDSQEATGTGRSATLSLASPAETWAS